MYDFPPTMLALVVKIRKVYLQDLVWIFTCVIPVGVNRISWQTSLGGKSSVQGIQGMCSLIALGRLCFLMRAAFIELHVLSLHPYSRNRLQSRSLCKTPVIICSISKIMRCAEHRCWEKRVLSALLEILIAHCWMQERNIDILKKNPNNNQPTNQKEILKLLMYCRI